MTEVLNAELIHAHFIREFLKNPRPKEQICKEMGMSNRTLGRFMHKTGKTGLYTLAKIQNWLNNKEQK